MSTLLDDLTAVRELLSVPERWTKGTFAKSKGGSWVPECSDDAVCWCLAGAIFKVNVTPDSENATFAHVEQFLGGELMGDWNDAPNRTHAQVLALLDLAIKAAR